jgi:very-short-patch-repair endonuclease
LEQSGYKVLRFWEHEMKSIDGVVERIKAALQGGV